MLVAATSVRAQEPMTLSTAVERALANAPAIQASTAQVEAAAAAIQLARTAYLPRLDTIAQFNAATRNNVFGLLLPQSVLPSISGPVLGTNNTAFVAGGAVGALVTWEPFDFGVRGATVAAAGAARTSTAAVAQRSRFDIAAATADAYLTLAAAQHTLVAARAGVDRAQVLVTAVDALVNAELRPGVDGSRARAELAAAQTQAIQAEQAVATAHAMLGPFVGTAADDLTAVTPPLPGDAPLTPFVAANTPAAQTEHALVEQTVAELHALERAYFPRVLLQGSAYARGADTLAPDVQNYAVGVSVVFPVLDFAAVHARQAERAATARAEEARERQLALDLRARWNAAVASLDGARRIAANTPSGVAAARAATEQARARYQSGLGTLVELADVQRLLTSAEIDDTLARLNVWRARLAVAVAAGDITPFVEAFR
jgi:outer membrane protein TolC